MSDDNETTCRYGVGDAHTFNHDASAQQHARNWATNFYGPDHADLFVAWLMTLSDIDQDRVYHLGYPMAAAVQFEQDYPDIRS